MTLFNFFAGLSWGLSSNLLLWLLAVRLSAAASEINDEPEFLMFLLWFFSSLLHFGHVIHCNLYNLEGLQSKFWTSVGQNTMSEWLWKCLHRTGYFWTLHATCKQHAPHIETLKKGKGEKHFHFDKRESSTYILPSTPSLIPSYFRRQTRKQCITARSRVEREDHKHERIFHLVLVTQSCNCPPLKEQVKSFSEPPFKPAAA